jgi:uncharacterized protein YjbI with pentapeptide repeats
MADKIDPFDVKALGDAVNDSASRVSTIWVSFLIFSLYLLTAASTVTHRQLFLADPVKLPVLNIDLPLWGFFFLAPILFVTFHIYVLLQVLLLAHTAAAYNAAVERAGFAAEESASLRQRLTNTLFAQIFAGAPRESDGWIGWMLKTMAWFTLAIAPVMILVVFQFAFLPYHSHLATWTHRLLILAELAAAIMLWPLVIDAHRDFEWARIWMQCKRTVTLPFRLFGQKHKRYDEWVWLRQQSFPLALTVLFVIASLSLATFPGEPHVNLLTGHAPFSVQCDRWLQHQFYLVDLRFDRLDLPHIDVVDHEKLEKIEAATEKAGDQGYKGERMRVIRGRDLNCGNFSDYSDLRRVDLTDSRLKSANFSDANLQGASLTSAEIQDAYFGTAQLQETSFEGAQLRGAFLFGAMLQGANLEGAELQGANLDEAQLQGADLAEAELQGADLEDAQLQGASLFRTQLQGANLDRAQLQGASLTRAEFQGANLNEARLQGASLYLTELQGVSFDQAQLTFARLSGVYVWLAKNAKCQDSHVSNHKSDDTIAFTLEIPSRSIKATPDETAKFIERSVNDIPEVRMKELARKRMRAGLVVDPAKDDAATIDTAWRNCEDASAARSAKEFDRKHAEFLRDLVCENSQDGKSIARGIISNWILEDTSRRDFSVQLAKGLLGQDGKDCAVTKDLRESDRLKLRTFVAHVANESSVSAPAPSAEQAQ